MDGALFPAPSRPDEHYFGAAVLGGAGVRYYGDYCTIHGMEIKYGATVYNDIQFGYNLESWNTRFDVGVNNVADKQPPFLFANNTLNANTDPSDFDLLGRYYWGRVTVKF